MSVVASSTPAFAHAALTKATPKDGAKLDAVPETVEINYAEPPTTDTRFSVIDGCGNDVAQNVDVLNQSVTADVSTGQPGDWRVEWSVVSAVDGHLTKDGVAFTVTGEADCDQAAGEDVPTEDNSEGSNIPVIPIAVATAVILAIAVVLRLRSN
jgi:methionine-rich copper-binding protein CopC